MTSDSESRRRPSVTVDCVADQYASHCERIIEFFDPISKTGGLISLRHGPVTGKLTVEVYNVDSDVIVLAPIANQWWRA